MKRSARHWSLHAAWVLVLAGCISPTEGSEPAEGPPAPPEHSAELEILSEPVPNPLRDVYFGDLHVHTAYSMDAWSFGTRAEPADAYRTARDDEELDFAAATDHSEFIGEVELCTDPTSDVYGTQSCMDYQTGDWRNALIDIVGGVMVRKEEICGADLSGCTVAAQSVWQRTIDAAEAANAPGSFSALVGYEWTAQASNGASVHRNVIFRDADVPALPISFVEETEVEGLWAGLRNACLRNGTTCDVLTIPHNTNTSGSQAFSVEYPGASTVGEQRRQALLRARLEPLMEIYQHKGASECSPYSTDEQCGFEALPYTTLCRGDATPEECLSRMNYLRGALGAGLQERLRLGVNPFRVGVIASTDTHNGTPGDVEEDRFDGHISDDDATPEQRVAGGMSILSDFSPGGLAAVWAETNSREDIFDALRRRETYGTSGPRMSVRFFGSFGYETLSCDDADLLTQADAGGVPMGGMLSSGTTGPRFVIQALPDRTPLAAVQVVKGWVDPTTGEARQRIFDVLTANDGVGTDPAICSAPVGDMSALCEVFQDPDFDGSTPAYYYVRVLEVPTCRWSTHDCNGLSDTTGTDCDTLPQTVQERAWTSPIWYAP